MSKVYLRSVVERSVDDVVGEIMNALDYESIVHPDAKVVVKVNLSTPFAENAEASNTDPKILDAVLGMLKKRTPHIWVGESNGMRYDTEDAFEVSGYIPIIEKRLAGVVPSMVS